VKFVTYKNKYMDNFTYNGKSYNKIEQVDKLLSSVRKKSSHDSVYLCCQPVWPKEIRASDIWMIFEELLILDAANEIGCEHELPGKLRNPFYKKSANETILRINILKLARQKLIDSGCNPPIQKKPAVKRIIDWIMLNFC